MNRKNGITKTFTELSPRYETVIDLELSRFWGWRYADFVNHLIQSTPIQESDIILDVATGTALIPRMIFKDHIIRTPIHGLDITPAMLSRAQRITAENSIQSRFCFVCASAMSMPYANDSFSVILCGLASHHMDVPQVVTEIQRLLRPDGSLSIADVGGFQNWNIPGLKLLLKIAAFIYFSFKENIRRAWAEADSVSNIRRVEEWHSLLQEKGFVDIDITRLESKYFWIPQPILIRATKKMIGDINGNNN